MRIFVSTLGVRIVGGEPSDPNSIPWQVALVKRWERYPFCGGTILCPKFIMTAAHCMYVGNYQLKPEDIEVMVGEHDVTASDSLTRHEVGDQIRNYFLRKIVPIKKYGITVLSRYNYSTFQIPDTKELHEKNCK